MAVNLFEVQHQETKEIWQEIEDSDGVVTPEQELRLYELMVDMEVLLQNAAKVAQLEANIELLKEWVRAAQARYRTWEYTVGKLRALMLDPLKRLLPDWTKPRGKKSLLTQGGALRIGLRSNNKGSLDIGPDEALQRETTIRGYTLKQVEESSIEARYFEKREVYVLRKDVLADEVRLVEGSDVERPARLGLARIDYEPSVVLSVLGGASGKRTGSGEVEKSEGR